MQKINSSMRGVTSILSSLALIFGLIVSSQIGSHSIMARTITNPFSLRFPVKNYTPYTAPIVSVFDHLMTSPYSKDDIIVAYTGDEARKSYPTPCEDTFKQANGQPFDFGQKGNYVGYNTCGGPARLSYDGHPGFDYRFGYGKAIYPAISGYVSYTENASGGSTPESYHVLTIDPRDGSGYKVFYLHLSSWYESGKVKKRVQEKSAYTITECTECPAPGTWVDKNSDQLIGYVGDYSKKWSGVGAHLHFEVTKDGHPVDPYGWEGTGQDPYQYTSVKLWESSNVETPTPPTAVISMNGNGQKGTNGQTLNYKVPPGVKIKMAFNAFASQGKAVAIKAYNWTRNVIFGNKVQGAANAANEDTTVTSQLPSFEDDLGPGTHNITLKVTDESGLSDTKTATIVITETTLSAPHAVISMSSGGQTGGNGSTLNYMVSSGSISMNFNAADSQAGSGSTITSYEWRSNGTVISTASSLTFPFGAAYHAITLKVTNSAGLSDSASATIIITESTSSAPAAAISMTSGGQTGGNSSTLNYTVSAGGSITMSFNGSGSQPGTGSITNYEWRSNGTVIGNLPSFNFPFAAASHTITLKVTNSSGLSNTATATIVVTTGTSAPGINSVSPNPVSGSNSSQPFTINGSGFTSQSTVTLRDKSTGEVFTNRAISSRTSTQLVTNPNFTTAAHTWSVEVLNGTLSSGEFTFQVVVPGAPPTISSVSPNPMTGSTTPQSFTINGTGFTSGSTVTLRSPFQTYPNQPATSITSSQIVMQVNLGTTPAQWTVEVIDHGVSSGQFAFQVVAPVVTPTISSVSPNPVTGSNSAQAFTINGTGFTAQSTVTLRDKTTGEVFANRAIGSQSSSQLVINPNFTTAAHTWSVEVLNGSLSSGQFTFQVTAPVVNPAISSVSPNPVTGSNSSQTFIINGSGFTSGSTVTLRSPFQTYPNQPTTSITGNQIVMQVNLGTTAAQWMVEVINQGTSSGQFAFQVVAPALPPTISSVNPNPVTGSNSAQPFTINGLGFASSSTVTLRDKSTGEVFANRAISSRTSTQIIINPNFTTAAHTWSVEVLNGNLSSGEFTFQVIAPASPHINSVSPNPMNGSDSSQTFTINGSGFTSNSTVTLRSPFQTYSNQPTSSITSTQIMMQVNLGTTAAQWTVEVIDHGISSSQFAFQVVAPAPRINNVSPNPVIGSNSSQPFTMNGSGFTSSSTVTLRDKSTGEVFANRSISSRTSTQLVINPNFTTAVHTWSVEVLNGTQSSGEFTFQVVASPTPSISSISPPTPVHSGSNQNVTVFGSNFQSGLTVFITFPSGGSTTLSGTQIQSVTANSFVMIATLGSSGGWSIRVNNPDGKQSNTFFFSVQ